MSVLSKAYFHDEAAAFAKLEEIVWPDGPVCPHCGGMERAYDLTKTRLGLKKCGHCRKQFTVRVGTVFEASHVPLHKWFQATFLMVSSKKGISAHQLHRVLEVTYKTAWFMAHRIREAMRSGDLSPFGIDGGAVEVDETFIGNDRTIKPKGQKKGRGFHHKHKVLALVDRNTGKARTMVVDDLKATTLAPVVRENLAREARLMTDEASYYTKVGQEFAEHGVVHHNRGEYGRGDVYTNTVEGYFSIFKRGMKGVYQHCGKKHLHRYVAEFEFRYNERDISDVERAGEALKGISGKRLTYNQPCETQIAS
ncbi:IS1595 family transposase [Oceanibacterium hippocampi]|uniref:ISXO2-like transposase domain protein n=1 Tax=Oceanibacterium hippocampi TaxID=745714 RepID=A0A1Y5SM56_9PROT|nr:IS1595 family transposase [Oceanibacterium hippocampi]SLN43932.1 ISXO2-like transposase domain protein [Oceanibacterium hippocampi]